MIISTQHMPGLLPRRVRRVFLCAFIKQSGKADQTRRIRPLDDRPTTGEGQTRTPPSEPCCPACQQREAYRLADGRYKCKRCKIKYSSKRTRARVSPATLHAIAESFWAMQTAEQCSEILDINRKTAQSYYSLLRSAIYDKNRSVLQQMGKASPGGDDPLHTDHYPVFWSLIQHQRLWIIFPERPAFSLREEDWPDGQGISEVFTRSRAARNNIVLDKFYRRTLWARNKADELLLQQFWRQAKINLARYRGGSKSRFPHFITEMAFRFNHHESEGALRLLRGSISGAPSET